MEAICTPGWRCRASCVCAGMVTRDSASVRPWPPGGLTAWASTTLVDWAGASRAAGAQYPPAAPAASTRAAPVIVLRGLRNTMISSRWWKSAGSAELECGDAVPLRHVFRGGAVQIHAARLEPRRHHTPGPELRRSPVRRRHVDEHLRARRHGRQQPGQQSLRHVLVVGEQRPHLCADLARPDHPIAGKSPVSDACECVAWRPVGPDLQETLARSTEDAGVEGDNVIERQACELDNRLRPLAAGSRAPADVPVGLHQTAALVVLLLRHNAVEPDDPGGRMRKRPIEQHAPRASAAQLGADDEEPDERVALAVERTRDRARDLAAGRSAEECFGVGRGEPFRIIEPRVPPLRVRPRRRRPRDLDDHARGSTWSSTSGPTPNWPLNGRACDAINTSVTATAAAKTPIASAAVVRLSTWTKAIARSVSNASAITALHFTQLTLERLTMMRCRRASSAFSSCDTRSRCAVTWPSLFGLSVSASCSACASAPGTIVSVAFWSAIAGHSRVAATWMCCRISASMRRAGAPGNEAPTTSCVERSALASRLTASRASLRSFHSPATRNPTISPNTRPIGGSMPGETARNAAPHRSLAAALITPK